LDFADNLGGVARATHPDQDDRTLVGKPQGCRTTYPGAGAGDQDNFLL
jgi:hypothetical protein